MIVHSIAYSSVNGYTNGGMLLLVKLYVRLGTLPRRTLTLPNRASELPDLGSYSIEGYLAQIADFEHASDF